MASGGGVFKSVLIIGVSGLVGHGVHRVLANRAGEMTGVFSRAPFHGSRGRFVALDISRPDALRRLLNEVSPTAVFNCAAMADIASCEAEPDAARRINTDAPAAVAEACRGIGARLVHFSTDQVFDGSAAWYDESAAVAPVHVYGRTKADGEQAVLQSGADALVIRLSLVYGRSLTGRRSASEQIGRALRQGRTLRLYTDEFRTPVSVDDAARAAACLTESGARGLVHVAGPDRASRYEFGLAAAERLGLDAALIQRARSPGLLGRPPRPLDLSLTTRLAAALLPFQISGFREGLLRML